MTIPTSSKQVRQAIAHTGVELVKRGGRYMFLYRSIYGPCVQGEAVFHSHRLSMFDIEGWVKAAQDFKKRISKNH